MLDRLLAGLERRFGRYAPENITIWLVGLSGLAYALLYVKPDLYPAFTLDPQAVLHGEAWRLVTFLFLPWGGGSRGVLGPLFTVFALMFLYTVGTSLEAQWGSLRFDVYYLLGIIGTVIASLLVGSITNEYINLSLLLAFATEFPDYQILLFLVLPVRMKWLGIFSAAGLVWAFITGSAATRAGVTVAMANYLLFFAGPLMETLRGKAGGRARAQHAAAVFKPEARKARVCALCGRSDADDRGLEFRVCDCAEKCKGKLTEYCIEHARNH